MTTLRDIMTENKFKLMTTNEEQRIRSDRNIAIDKEDILYEILGGAKGNKIVVELDDDGLRFWSDEFHDGDAKLVVYNNDEGFNDDDKYAIRVKNKSGTIDKTSGMNGFGLKMIIDRLFLDENHEHSECNENISYIFSLNDMTVLQFKAGFVVNEWESVKDNSKEQHLIKEYEHIHKNSGGSLFVLHISHHWLSELLDTFEIKKTCMKFLNYKLRDPTFEFVFNRTPCEISSLSYNVEPIYLEIGYDQKEEKLSPNHKKPIIAKINNEYYKMKDATSTTIEHSFNKTEDVTLYLKVLKDDEWVKSDWCKWRFDKTYLNGVNVYINGFCVNKKGLKKNLGGKAEDGGAIGQQEFGGSPFFQIHVKKTTNLYLFPSDKSNIKCTSKGEILHGFVRLYVKKIKKQKDIIEQETLEHIDNEVEVVDSDNEVEVVDSDNEVEVVDSDNVNVSLASGEWQADGVDSENEEPASFSPIIKNKVLRKEFGTFIKKKQRNDNLSRLWGIRFSQLSIGGFEFFEYDHVNNDRNDNSDENCDIKDLCEHAMKTKNEAEYKKFIDNDTDVIDFRFKHICDLINGISNKGDKKTHKFQKEEHLDKINKCYDKIIKLAKQCQYELATKRKEGVRGNLGSP